MMWRRKPKGVTRRNRTGELRGGISGESRRLSRAVGLSDVPVAGDPAFEVLLAAGINPPAEYLRQHWQREVEKANAALLEQIDEHTTELVAILFNTSDSGTAGNALGDLLARLDEMQVHPLTREPLAADQIIRHALTRVVLGVFFAKDEPGWVSLERIRELKEAADA